MKQSAALMIALLGASSGGAWAQSSVQQEPVRVYGVIDAGVVKEDGCPGGCTLRIDSGLASESRIGVRGIESLSDRLSAVFTLEAGVQTDTGKSSPEGGLFGRQAYVGVQGNGGSSLTIGRQQNLDFLTLVDVGDPFKGGMAGAATNLIGNSGPRTNNAIHYYSGEVHGISAAASYGAVEDGTFDSSNRAWGISVGIESGPLVIRAAHQNRGSKVAPATPMGNNTEVKNSIIAANLRVGVGTAYAAYSINRGWGSSPLWNPDNPYSASMASTPSTDSRDILVGFALPVGPTTFLASYILKNDRDLANRDAHQVAFGASYAVSPRTDFFAAISRITNRNGAGYTVGNASSAGHGNSAVNIGMRHAF